MNRKISYLTIVVFILSTLATMAFGVENVATDTTSPSVMKNEPSEQADSVINQNLVPEHSINAQHFIVNVEKVDDYVISIMIDTKIRISVENGEIIRGCIYIYDYESGRLFKKLELGSAKANDSGYELDHHVSGPLLTFNIPKKGKYVFVSDVRSLNKKINSYSLHFSRVIPTKSFFD